MKNNILILGSVTMICATLMAGLFLFSGNYIVTNAKEACPPISRKSFNLHRAIGKENVVPIVVIGSGPAGLSAALYGARGGIDTLVIEGNKPGGLLTETTEVENWPGEISIMGPDLMIKMREQVKRFGVGFLADAVEKVDLTTWPFQIVTEGGQNIHALSLIITTGANPRKLNIPGEDIYWGSGVTSCATCDAPFFKDEQVVVIGGGDSAVEEALQLAKYASHVTVLVRSNKMRAASRMQDRLREYKNVSVRYNLSPQEIIGDGTKVTGIKLCNTTTQEYSVMPINGVFLATGHDPSTKLFVDQIDLTTTNHIILDTRTQETSMPGVFAAGDVADNRYRQAIVSAGDGVKAALDAIHFLEDIGLNPDIADQMAEKRSGLYIGTRGPSMVKHVHSLNELDKLNQKGVVIVDFFAEYCPSCLQMLPVFDTVSIEFPDILFVKVDTDQAVDIVDKYAINKIPCILVFKDGKLTARYNNAMSKKELQKFVSQFV
jgi:thioredoxin reductase (NADPH)